MQLANQNFADQLKSKVIEAVWDSEKWGEVLDQIIMSTPACAAIITLREKRTCQIVNDVELEAHYHSPLIQGFSLEAVQYYLTELREIDPWAECQRTHYPFRPMLMSAVKAPESAPYNRFFNWLNDLGMYDSVVFELDRMAGYWSACNLFLPSRDVADARELMTFVNQNFEFLSKAWKTSQGFEQNRQTANTLLEHFDENGQPCCIVGPNGELGSVNSKFEELLAEGYVRLSGPKKKISFSRDVSVSGLGGWEDHALTYHDHVGEPVRAVAKPVEPDPRFTGKREKSWVLVFHGASQPSVEALDHADPNSLSLQERRLFDEILAGLSVEDAGLKIGVKRSRAFEIWQSVKAKMNISSAHELRKRAAG